MQTDIKTLLTREIAVINGMLQAHQIQAGTALTRTMCVRSSFIAYGLKVAPGQAISRIENIQRELANELARSRLKFGYSAPCPVRVRDYPLAIEVPTQPRCPSTGARPPCAARPRTR